MNSANLVMSQVKKNQIRMVLDRGYVISEEEEKMLDMEPIDLYVATTGYSKMDRIYKKKDDPDSELGVFYRFKDNIYVPIEYIQDVIDAIHQGLKSVILILNGNLSPPAKDNLDKMLTCKVQLWMQSDLYANPTENIYTPKHQVLSKEEEDALIRATIEIKGDTITHAERTRAKNMLPQMHHSDIIRKWYAFSHGSIIKCICDYSVLHAAEKCTAKYRVVM